MWINPLHSETLYGYLQWKNTLNLRRYWDRLTAAYCGNVIADFRNEDQKKEGDLRKKKVERLKKKLGEASVPENEVITFPTVRKCK